MVPTACAAVEGCVDILMYAVTGTWHVLIPCGWRSMSYAPVDCKGQGSYFSCGNDDFRLKVDKEGYRKLI